MQDQPLPFPLKLICDLSDRLQGRTVSAAGIGADETVALLLDLPLIDPIQPKRIPLPRPAVLLARNGEVRELGGGGRSGLIQPLLDGGYVIASTVADGDREANARRFDAEGRLLTEFYIDDSAECLMADGHDNLWFGYCVDGVATGWGNFANGICRFSSSGRLLWSWPRPVDQDEIEAVVDCHALNVVADAVWACSQGPSNELVQISAGGSLRMWHLPTTDIVLAFACDGAHALTIARHNDQPSGKWLLWDIGDESLENPSTVASVPALPLKQHLGARGPILYIEDGGRIYRGDIREIGTSRVAP